MKRNNIKNVTFYVMSSNDEAGKAAGQYWSSMEAWPKALPTKFYLHGDGSVSTKKPSDSDGLSSSSSFVYDPANPIKTQGGNNLWSDAPCGPLDQQDIDRRADVLVFQTPVFEEELALTGALNGHLYVSSDAIDTDFMVSRKFTHFHVLYCVIWYIVSILLCINSVAGLALPTYLSSYLLCLTH